MATFFTRQDAAKMLRGQVFVFASLRTTSNLEKAKKKWTIIGTLFSTSSCGTRNHLLLLPREIPVHSPDGQRDARGPALNGVLIGRLEIMASGKANSRNRQVFFLLLNFFSVVWSVYLPLGVDYGVFFSSNS